MQELKLEARSICRIFVGKLRQKVKARQGLDTQTAVLILRRTRTFD